MSYIKSERISIRLFKSSDLEEVVEIEKRSFPSPWSRPIFRHYHLKDPEGFLVAVKKGTIVGYAIIDIENIFNIKELRYAKQGHLLNLAVKPEFKKRGIGRMLVDSTIVMLEEKGVPLLSLEVRRSNQDAIKFYEAMNFQREGFYRKYYGDEDAVIMRKKL